MLNSKSRKIWTSVTAALVLMTGAVSAEHTSSTSRGAKPRPEKYLALSLDGRAGDASADTLNRYGIPFHQGILPLHQGGSAEIPVGGQVKRIFLLGMTDENEAFRKPESPSYSLHSGSGPRTIPAYGWQDPRDYSYRFFIGDELGRIRLIYLDGSTQVFPLLLGEGVWWGRAFYDFQEPFPSDAHLQKAFAAALRLYRPAPRKDGDYVAVITPKSAPIRSIAVENSPAKKGTLVIQAITLESADPHGINDATPLPEGQISPELEAFARTRALRPLGQDEKQAEKRFNDLRHALYSSDESSKGSVAQSAPPGYAGPHISFQGSHSAQVLANVFRYNVQDILAKIGPDGMYHTSTKHAISWGGYRAFGTFRKDVGGYYDVSYTRDMGRSLQEIADLGYTNAPARNVDYDFRLAHRYATDPALRYKGVALPPHWGDLVNRPRNPSFENDGQGLAIMAIYKIWQRLPDRDTWLRSRWPDVKAAGDWILWQFDHPEISGATNGVLRSTGESANGVGFSVYPDTACMFALEGLAHMADSIGETETAQQWRNRAEQMRHAITIQYTVSDPKYGRVWTLESANWTHKGTVLGPLILPADYLGFAPEDSIEEWRASNEATYQRLLETYKPFGFYGQAMGYGQGFVTQSGLLLDRMRDATRMLDWTAKQIYDPRYGSYIVPEGVQIDSTGRFWFRMGDLGNGVQEAEIIKTLRIVVGVDDTQPERVQFFPRMPYDWKEMAVDRYPILFKAAGKLDTAHLAYKLKRSGNRMDLTIFSDKALGPVAARVGPFAKHPKASSIRINGNIPAAASVERSGDSWWIRFSLLVGEISGRESALARGSAPGASVYLAERPRP